MSYYTLEQVRERRAQQDALGFDEPPAYRKLTDQQVADNANGVGPDAFPSIARKLLTLAVEYGDLPADIHDVEYRLSDGTTVAFLAANGRWYHNSRLWISANRSRFNPRRYIELWRAARDRDILDGPAGRDAWDSAFKRYKGAPIA